MEKAMEFIGLPDSTFSAGEIWSTTEVFMKGTFKYVDEDFVRFVIGHEDDATAFLLELNAALKETVCGGTSPQNVARVPAKASRRGKKRGVSKK
jgi:hypothetical protein